MEKAEVINYVDLKHETFSKSKSNSVLFKHNTAASADPSFN